jgi:hypothetical protein
MARPEAGTGLKDLGFKAVTGFHRWVFVSSTGRLAGSLLGMPVVLLSTTGRKSGVARHSMLTRPLELGESFVLVASFGGDDRHPAWFLTSRRSR